MALPANQEEIKTPKVFGSFVYVAYLVKTRGKAKNPNRKVTETQVNFALSRERVEIYQSDWKLCLYSLPIDRIRPTHVRDNVIKFTYTLDNDQQQDVSVRFDRADIILAAFSPNIVDKQKDGISMTILDLPTVLSFGCSLNEQLAQTNFKPYLEAQARKRLIFLTSSVTISDSLLMAIACEFRMRFPQIEAENWIEAFDVLWYEFVAFCVSLWTQCLKTSIEQHTGPNAFEYFRRLTASIIGLIARGADVFGVDRCALLEAGRKFIDYGDSSSIPDASRKIVTEVELALGNIRKRWLLQLSDLFEFTQVYTAGVTIAHALAGETKEGLNLSQMISSWANSLVNNLINPPRMNEFKNSLEKLAVNVLKLNDENRYAPDFHCVLALWKLSQLVKNE